VRATLPLVPGASDAELGADGGDEPVESPPEPARRDLRWVWVAVLVGLPILALVASLAHRTWYPTGDQAQAELRMRSLPRNPPLVGAAGRIQDAQGRQGNHPGPLMFWVTWPLYAILGRSSWAFEAATALVNLAWLSVSVWLVNRRAGIGLCRWYGIVTLALLGGYGLDALSQPWNPWVGLLPFTVLILATWSTLEGDWFAPVLAVAAASYAIQGHVGYAPVALPLVLLCVTVPIWRWWRSPRRSGDDDDADADADDGDGPGRSGRSPVYLAGLGLGVLVAVLAWSGPMWDVATSHPNNVSKLIANFGSPSDPPIGLHRAITAVLQAAHPFGPWLWGGAAVKGSVLPGLAFLVLWASIAIIVGIRRDQPQLRRLNALLAVETAIGLVAVSRIFGALYLYTFRWIVAIVALQVFSLGWGVWALLPRPMTSRRLGGVALVALITLSLVTSVRIAREEIPYDQSWRAEQVLAPQTAAHLDPNKRYLIRWDDPAYLGGLGFGLMLDLERRGFHVGGDPRFAAAIEPHRVMCPGDYDAVLTVVTGDHTIAAHRSAADDRQIAAADPRRNRKAWNRSYAQLLDVLRSRGQPQTPANLEKVLNLLLLAPGQPPEVTKLAGQIVLGGVPSAVFLADPAPPSAPVGTTALDEPCR